MSLVMRAEIGGRPEEDEADARPRVVLADADAAIADAAEDFEKFLDLTFLSREIQACAKKMSSCLNFPPWLLPAPGKLKICKL